MPQSALRAATERGVDRVNLATSTQQTFQTNLNSISSPSSSSSLLSDSIPFYACGISSVIHPKNPHCPTIHFNYRYFETAGGVWWFGGGTDITPSYLNEEDISHFHGVYKAICDRHDPQFYQRFKQWADKYYFIPHRNETRGLGGIFFDDLNDRDPNLLLNFARDGKNKRLIIHYLIESFLNDLTFFMFDNLLGLAGVIPAYAPIINKHKFDPFTTREKEWQQIRRGRSSFSLFS